MTSDSLNDLTDAEETIIDWYKARRMYFDNGREEAALHALCRLDIKLEMFAISVLAPNEYKKILAESEIKQ